VVLTGGPGGGKTAVLEVVRRHFCEHIVVLPEAASLLFGGGFPRLDSDGARRAAQRAIFHAQVELETLAESIGDVGLVLCDRGVVDGAAYWPDGIDGLFDSVGATRVDAQRRYAGVVHLRTPAAGGYDHSNPMRVESLTDAMRIDARIFEAWSGHPARVVVEAEADFLAKLTSSLDAIRGFLPACCRAHEVSP
jgi:predicted ATPase